MAIITAAGWKAYRGFPGTAYDATLAVVIPMAQAEIERFLSCKLDSATYTDQPHDGTGTGVLYTRNWPVSTLTAVKYRNADATTETLASTQYSMATGADTFGRLLRQPQGGVSFGVGESPCWEVGRENVLITYTAGYSEDTIPVPADLQLAAYLWVDSILAARGYARQVASQGMGNENLTFRPPAETLAESRRLLGPFMRRVL